MLISVSGPIGAGKTTVAFALDEALAEEGFQTEVIGLADPIKAFCQKVGVDPYSRATKETTQLNIVYKLAYASAFSGVFWALNPAVVGAAFNLLWERIDESRSERNEYGDTCLLFSPRQLQQWVGDAVRAVDENFFVRYVKFVASKTPEVVFILHDVRYLNEMNAADYKVYVERANNPHMVVTTHSSEAHQAAIKEQCNFIIDNQKTLSYNVNIKLLPQFGALIDDIKKVTKNEQEDNTTGAGGA